MAERGPTAAEVLATVAAGRSAEAAEAVVRALGPELRGWLHGTMASAAEADEAYARFSEDLLRGLRSYRGEASVRTWAYQLARSARHRVRTDAYARRAVPEEAAEEPAVRPRTETDPALRSGVKDALRRVRAELPPEDQDILVLRVDRAMGWAEIAAVLDLDPSPRGLAALRKRFERLKERLRVRLAADGLLAAARDR